MLFTMTWKQLRPAFCSHQSNSSILCCKQTVQKVLELQLLTKYQSVLCLTMCAFLHSYSQSFLTGTAGACKQYSSMITQDYCGRKSSAGMRMLFHLQAQGVLPLVDVPAWTLEDDNSGLNSMLEEQVCAQLRLASLSLLDLTGCDNCAYLQRTVQWLTNVQSALTVLQSCIVTLIILQFASIASPLPHFRLFFGTISACL